MKYCWPVKLYLRTFLLQLRNEISTIDLLKCGNEFLIGFNLLPDGRLGRERWQRWVRRLARYNGQRQATNSVTTYSRERRVPLQRGNLLRELLIQLLHCEIGVCIQQNF